MSKGAMKFQAIFLVCLAVGLLAFQNCSRVEFAALPELSSSAKGQGELVDGAPAEGAIPNTGGGGDDAPAVPGDDTTKPGDDTTKPGDDTTKPGDEGPKPVTPAPGDDTTKPGDDTTKPGDRGGPKPVTPAPGDDTTKPGDDTTKPGDDTTKPTDTGKPAEIGKPGDDGAPDLSNCKKVKKSDIANEANGDRTVKAKGNGKGAGSKKTLVCHVVPGNGKKITLSVGNPATLHGHMPGAHGGDYLGACDDGMDDAPEIEVCEQQ